MPFKTILEELTTRTGAAGAIMLDSEGEAVNLYSTSRELELDAIGAHKVIILNMLKDIATRRADTGGVKQLWIATTGMKLAISAINEDHYLLVAMDRGRSMGRAFYESRRAVRKIVEEIG